MKIQNHLHLIFSAVILIFTTIPTPATGSEICSTLRSAKIVAQDPGNSYLGRISNSYDTDSIFNSYGEYGNPYSSIGIWNNYSEFGNPYGIYSPFNSYSSSPPMIVKSGRIIGYLTANKSIKSGISPKLLKALCEDEL
jgi:hypothetical protein